MALDVMFFSFTHVFNQNRLQSQSQGFDSMVKVLSDVLKGVVTSLAKVVKELDEISRDCNEVKPLKDAGKISLILLVEKFSEVRVVKLADEENDWSSLVRAFEDRSILVTADRS